MAITDFDKEIGSRIAYILEEEYPEVSKDEIAELLGIAPPNLSEMFSGKRKFRVEMIYQIAERLGCSTDYLLGRSEVPSVDADIQAACAYTGLPEKVMERLAVLCRNNAQVFARDSKGEYPETVVSAVRAFEDLVMCLDFWSFLFDTDNLRNSVRIGKQALDNPDRFDNNAIIPIKDMIELSQFRLSKSFLKITDKLYQVDEVVDKLMSLWLSEGRQHNG